MVIKLVVTVIPTTLERDASLVTLVFTEVRRHQVRFYFSVLYCHVTIIKHNSKTIRPKKIELLLDCYFLTV